jgi:ubiquinone/menaquinone biosynthesis C-methylase UbiE/uncharacterized protein YbaR (Trm112 family)
MLRCPQCTGALALRDTVSDAHADIETGELTCAHCPATYPIEHGIAHLASKDEVVGAYPVMEEQARIGAPFYDAGTRRFSEIIGVSPEDARPEYLRHLELIPKATVLDVGAGTGAELEYVWSKIRDARMFGLDLSVEMLRQCQRKMRKINAHAELFLGFAERLPFRDDTFDVVFHTGAINEFTDQRAAIREFVRVAKPGTRIVIADEMLTTQNILDPIGQRLSKTFPSLSRGVVPPVDCVPPGMQDTSVDVIWRGYGYCLHFRKPR